MTDEKFTVDASRASEAMHRFSVPSFTRPGDATKRQQAAERRAELEALPKPAPAVAVGEGLNVTPIDPDGECPGGCFDTVWDDEAGDWAVDHNGRGWVLDDEPDGYTGCPECNGGKGGVLDDDSRWEPPTIAETPGVAEADDAQRAYLDARRGFNPERLREWQACRIRDLLADVERLEAQLDRPAPTLRGVLSDRVGDFVTLLRRVWR